jgi:sialic acid synthase SpsE
LCTEKELDAAVSILDKNTLMIMHCTSSYPTEPYEAELHKIFSLKEKFKDNIIGYSDHTIGKAAAQVAASIGAKLIEKHITLNRRGKGSDHICSSEPAELCELVESINQVGELKETNHGFSDEQPTGAVEKNRKKLMRSVCSRVAIKAGDRITEDHLTLMSPGDGIQPSEMDLLIWRLAAVDIPAKTKIELEMIK